mgnify:FL=1
MRASSLGKPGVKPLCWTDKGVLLAYAHGELIAIEEGQERALCKLPLGSVKRTLSHSRMASRALRIEPRAALVVGSIALVAWAGSVLLVDIHNGRLETLLRPRGGFSDPLYFTRAEGDDLLAVWGDYGTNPSRSSVTIWGLGSDGGIRSLFEFEPGRVRHVHGIISRMAGDGGYYVFTGDMEEKSGIYIASPDFSSMEPLAVGEQRFRAVRGFPIEDGLIYATDSASIENHAYRLHEDGRGSWSQLDDLGTLNGPCIYGGQVEGGYLFTTTIEPDESLQGISSLVSRSTGQGVFTPEATAVLVDVSGRMREVARIKSDGMPLKALQYGSLQVPSGTAHRNHVWVYSRSLKGVDGKAVRIGTEGL